MSITGSVWRLFGGWQSFPGSQLVAWLNVPQTEHTLPRVIFCGTGYASHVSRILPGPCTGGERLLAQTPKLLAHACAARHNLPLPVPIQRNSFGITLRLGQIKSESCSLCEFNGAVLVYSWRDSVVTQSKGTKQPKAT